MANTGWKQTQNAIEKNLEGLLSRTHSVSSYLNRILFRQYQKAQIERWQTENASQGSQWAPISEMYARRKRKKFASAPGGGNVIMTATGRLMSGAQATDSAYFFKKVTDKSFTIGINVGTLAYAVYPGVMRPYMEFNEETEKQWREKLLAFVVQNKES